MINMTPGKIQKRQLRYRINDVLVGDTFKLVPTDRNVFMMTNALPIESKSRVAVALSSGYSTQLGIDVIVYMVDVDAVNEKRNEK